MTARNVASHAETIIPAACGPLVEILEDETLSIINHSLTVFLTCHDQDVSKQSDETGETFPIIYSEATPKEIAIVCIKYMRSDWMGSVPVLSSASP